MLVCTEMLSVLTILISLPLLPVLFRLSIMSFPMILRLSYIALVVLVVLENKVMPFCCTPVARGEQLDPLNVM